MSVWICKGFFDEAVAVFSLYILPFSSVTLSLAGVMRLSRGWPSFGMACASSGVGGMGVSDVLRRGSQIELVRWVSAPVPPPAPTGARGRLLAFRDGRRGEPLLFLQFVPHKHLHECMLAPQGSEGLGRLGASARTIYSLIDCYFCKPW